MATSDSEDYETLDKELFGSDPEDDSQDDDPQSNNPLSLSDSLRSQYIISNLSEDMKTLTLSNPPRSGNFNQDLSEDLNALDKEPLAVI